jgi:hypothetical protein
VFVGLCSSANSAAGKANRWLAKKRSLMELLGFAVLLFVIFLIASWIVRPDEKISKLEIAKLEAKEGDVLLLRIKDEKPPMEKIEEIKYEIEKLLNNKIKCFVLGNVDVNIITLSGTTKLQETGGAASDGE